MATVMIPGRADKALLAQLQILSRRVAAQGRRVTGTPDLVPEAEQDAMVDRWIARVLVQDPDLLLIFATDGRRLTGAIVAELVRDAVQIRLVVSPSRGAGQQMLGALLAWGRACGARRILGWTFRSPGAWSRRVGTVHLRDQYLLEVS